MSDGLHIRWRETAPDRGLLAFALAEIDALHSAWPETLQCNIVIERAPLRAAECLAVGEDESCAIFLAHVELELGRRSPRVFAEGRSEDVYSALRSAFHELRDIMPTYAPRTSEVPEAVLPPRSVLPAYAGNEVAA